MRTLLLVVLVLGCGAKENGNSRPASLGPSKDSPTSEQGTRAPGCEDAVRAAAKKVAELANPAELSKVVAECVRDQWPDDARRCVASVKDEPDLVACMMRLDRQLHGPDREDVHLKVTGIEPAQGDAAGGTYVRIKGNRFIVDGPRSVKVYFGGIAGAVDRFTSDDELIVTTPGGKPGDVVDVIVIFEPGGWITLPRAFTFVDKQ
jgi:hypothetical protein